MLSFLKPRRVRRPAYLNLRGIMAVLLMLALSVVMAIAGTPQ